MKAGVVNLKKVCRQRTLTAWKEWRASMEQHRGASLRVSAPFQRPVCEPSGSQQHRGIILFDELQPVNCLSVN